MNAKRLPLRPLAAFLPLLLVPSVPFAQDLAEDWAVSQALHGAPNTVFAEVVSEAYARKEDEEPNERKRFVFAMDGERRYHAIEGELETQRGELYVVAVSHLTKEVFYRKVDRPVSGAPQQGAEPARLPNVGDFLSDGADVEFLGSKNGLKSYRVRYRGRPVEEVVLSLDAQLLARRIVTLYDPNASVTAKSVLDVRKLSVNRAVDASWFDHGRYFRMEAGSLKPAPAYRSYRFIDMTSDLQP